MLSITSLRMSIPSVVSVSSRMRLLPSVVRASLSAATASSKAEFILPSNSRCRSRYEFTSHAIVRVMAATRAAPTAVPMRMNVRLLCMVFMVRWFVYVVSHCKYTQGFRTSAEINIR